MASLSDYLSFFVLVEEAGLRSVLPTLMGVLPEMLRGGYPAVWIVLFLLLCESVAPWRKHQRRLREGVWLDLFYTVANFFLLYPLIATAVFQTAELTFRHALHDLFGVQLGIVFSLGELPRWVRYVLLFLMTDLLNYLGHVLLHRSNFLWTFHRVHHSARQLDVLNAVRIHWVEKLYYDFFTYVPMVLIGFEVQQVFAIRVASLLFCAATHSNLKVPLGPLKYVVNNPQLHLWHHAAEVPHDRNVNYGSSLSLWDSLFGTLHLPDDRNDIELGFRGIEDFPTTLWRQQLHPLDRLLPHAPKTEAADHRGLRRFALPAVLCGILGVVVAGNAIPESVLLLFGVGHQERARSLLAQGDAEAALAQLERSALIDQDRLDLLQRLERANRSAQFQTGVVSQYLGLAAGVAELRFRIGDSWTLRARWTRTGSSSSNVRSRTRSCSSRSSPAAPVRTP